MCERERGGTNKLDFNILSTSQDPSQNEEREREYQNLAALSHSKEIIIIILDNFCIALFSDVPKLTALYNILQHFLSFTNILIHIIMTTNNV